MLWTFVREFLFVSLSWYWLPYWRMSESLSQTMSQKDSPSAKESPREFLIWMRCSSLW